MVRRTFGPVSLLLAGTLVGASSAAASAEIAPAHCVVRLVATGPAVDGVVVAELHDVGCFTTLEATLEAGTGGEVTLSAAVGPDDLTQSLLDQVITGANDVLLGTEYDLTGFLAPSNSYFAPSGCAGTTWQVANVGATWNDRFESGKRFGTSDNNRKFEHADLGGSSVLCTPNCLTYGTLRNQITSLRWKD